MSVWEALEFLNQLVDDSDPDTNSSQLDHLLQTAEQIRKDGHPRWFILTGLIHDLGKILCSVWRTPMGCCGRHFPVGCAYPDKIVFHEFFGDNPDSKNPRIKLAAGHLRKNAGLDNVQMSAGATTNTL